MLLAEDGLSVEQLGRDDGITELFEELGVVGTVDSRDHGFLHTELAGAGQAKMYSKLIPSTCDEGSLSVLKETYRGVKDRVAGSGSVS